MGNEYDKCKFCVNYSWSGRYDDVTCVDYERFSPDYQRIICKAREENMSVCDVITLMCKLRLNGMPVPLLRNDYSIFNGTKYLYIPFEQNLHTDESVR